MACGIFDGSTALTLTSPLSNTVGWMDSKWSSPQCMFAAGTFKRDWKSHPKKVEVIHGFCISNENIFNIPTKIAQIVNYTRADPHKRGQYGSCGVWRLKWCERERDFYKKNYHRCNDKERCTLQWIWRVWYIWNQLPFSRFVAFAARSPYVRSTNAFSFCPSHPRIIQMNVSKCA